MKKTINNNKKNFKKNYTKKRNNEQTNLKKFYSKEKKYLEYNKKIAKLFFRTKDESKIEEENNRFINTVKKEQIDLYLHLVNDLIEILKKDKDLKNYEEYFLSICNNQKMKEI